MNMSSHWFRAGPLRFCQGLAGIAVVVIALLFVWVAPASGQEYAAQCWHLEDGLPDDDITAISQTPDGYLWVGTLKGLARFDGVRFKIFKTESNPELKDSRIGNLLTDREGTLWIGTLDGNLMRKTGTGFEPAQPPVPLPLDADKKRAAGPWLSDFHSRLIIDGEGSLWWQQTGKGIVRLKAGNWTIFTPSNGLPDGIIRQMVCDHEGRVWVESNGKISYYFDGRWNQPASPIIGDQTVLATAAKGGLWLAKPNVSWADGGGQIRQFEGIQRQAPALTIPPTQNPYWDAVSCLHEDKVGNLWVGSTAAGLRYFDANGEWHELNLTTLLSRRLIEIKCLFEDHQGNIWVGANDGLYRVTRQYLTMLPLLPSRQQIFTSFATRDGAVWVGTETAGVFRFESGKFKSVDGDWDAKTPQIFSLFQDSKTNLWAGTSVGLYQFATGRFRSVPGFSRTNWVSAIFEDRSGCLWFGTRYGLFSYQTGSFASYGPPVNIRSLAEDHSGVLWVGSMSGLFLRQSGEIQNLTRATNFPANDARALFCDRSGTLWVGSWGSGLLRRDHDRFANFTSADGLTSDRIGAICDDQSGRLWLFSNDGIAGIFPKSLQNYVRGESLPLLWFHFSTAEGLANRLLSGWGQPVPTRTDDGCLWFPDMEQMAVFDPAKINLKESVQNVPIESVLADGQDIPIGPEGSISCASGTRRFEFHYTAVDLREPHSLRFQYRLEGMDRDWVNAGSERTAYYSQLPPGNYKFRIMVGDHDGLWHEAAAPIRLQVIPRFWERPWVQLLTAALLTAGMVGAFMLNARLKLNRKLKWAEMQNAVAKERIRISRDIHDDLGSSLTHIAQLSELAQADFDQPKQAKSHIDEIFTTARRVARSVDEIVWAIDPKNDPLEMSLGYILKMAQDFLRASSIKCRLDFPEAIPTYTFSSSVRHQLYLAVRETLNNIVKHAAASEVQLRFNIEAGWLTIVIADNGRGFIATGAPATPGARVGHGLESMKNRLITVGGRCELESEPGRGTTIRLVLPLNPEEDKMPV